MLPLFSVLGIDVRSVHGSAFGCGFALARDCRRQAAVTRYRYCNSVYTWKYELNAMRVSVLGPWSFCRRCFGVSTCTDGTVFSLPARRIIPHGGTSSIEFAVGRLGGENGPISLESGVEMKPGMNVAVLLGNSIGCEWVDRVQAGRQDTLIEAEVCCPYDVDMGVSAHRYRAPRLSPSFMNGISLPVVDVTTLRLIFDSFSGHHHLFILFSNDTAITHIDYIHSGMYFVYLYLNKRRKRNTGHNKS